MQYIQALCFWRNFAEEPEIVDINDIRNGILADTAVHRFLDRSELAVLRVCL